MTTRAKVIKPFKGAPDGECHPKSFVAGDVVSGDLADVAIAEGWAKKMKGAPENKDKGAAPENKAEGGNVKKK